MQYELQDRVEIKFVISQDSAQCINFSKYINWDKRAAFCDIITGTYVRSLFSFLFSKRAKSTLTRSTNTASQTSPHHAAAIIVANPSGRQFYPLRAGRNDFKFVW